MRIYLVGGYVRDLYLTRELGYPKGNGDRDWVVVGATPQQMLQMGFKQGGKDFPVFLHPKTLLQTAACGLRRRNFLPQVFVTGAVSHCLNIRI